MDPLAEKYPGVSSYVYCADNTVKFVDPDGRDKYDIYEKSKGKDPNITVTRDDSKTNTYTYHNLDGGTVDLGTYTVLRRTIKMK